MEALSCLGPRHLLIAVILNMWRLSCGLIWLLLLLPPHPILQVGQEKDMT